MQSTEHGEYLQCKPPSHSWGGGEQLAELSGRRSMVARLYTGKGTLKILIVLLLCLNFVMPAQGRILDNKGDEFIMAFLPNALGMKIPSVELRIIADVGTSVTYVSGQNPAATKANETVTVDFQLELEQGTVTGTVVSAGKSEPIAGALVEMGDKSDLTDASGKYEISQKPDNYSVTVSHDDYVSVQEQITVKLGETVTVDFQLKLQNGGIVCSVVDADTLRVVAGVTIEVSGQQAETDSRGYCTFIVTPEIYEVSASARGYLIRSQEVEIRPGKITEIDLLAIPALEVWPGDTNNDGKVSILDILPIGRFWNMGGDMRQPLSIDWQAGMTILKGWNPREAIFADADGNGEVDERDIIVIAVNWGRIQPELLEFAPELADPMKLMADRNMLDRYQKMYQIVIGLEDSEGAIEVRDALDKLIDMLSPRKSELLANYPNPFNPETWIPFVLAEAGETAIKIYDTNGRLIRNLELGVLEAGYYMQKDRAAYWDGRNSIGEQTASGIYFYAIHSGAFSAARKMLILR